MVLQLKHRSVYCAQLIRTGSGILASKRSVGFSSAAVALILQAGQRAPRVQSPADRSSAPAPPPWLQVEAERPEPGVCLHLCAHRFRPIVPSRSPLQLTRLEPRAPPQFRLPRRREEERATPQRLSSTIGQAFFCLQTRPQPVAPFASAGVLSFHAPGAPEDVRERLARLLSLSAAMMTDPDAPLESLRQREESSSDGDAAETADEDAQQLTVQSLPYVKCRESVSAVFSFDSAARRRISLASNATSDTANSSPEHADKFPTSLSYSVPSTTLVTNTPRGRPAVDVIATYMNTCDQRTVKSELMRAHAHFAAEWGWFADIDSSSESWGGDGSVHSLRRRLSADLGLIDVGNVHVLGDEQTNTRITAAHKTFTIVTEGNSKVVSATVSIPKFRIVQSRSGADRHAQYLITLMLGKELYADWRRYSEFGELVKTLDEKRYSRTQDAWAGIETRWFNRLEPSYLHQKCITLENFMRELMYESNEPTVLINFLGGYLGKVNARPTDPVAYRPAAQLPKELRPPQPRHERELFEKMWAENFKRSHVDYSTSLAPTQTAS
ncbi:hypothetical protein PHYSODRAFT_490853 [Phytophthora sojae]|uniref:PX domain-containing protein n=1 Tax=Phytophthora sojae (strain P6497) TaxID=1094619 RepID=G4Z6A9_PHYSP|nr:hypothetical protein PHYSODRAFT_490853 [Phytophthora sojae]EGZ21724.1 hypothetical protein PHYSODRAFT_490853 [Phytophthora sojae]|eukprot:XP_009524441.1 hypothetical protein PHYSODRAFT_490853 [Phytophthora sojae]